MFEGNYLRLLFDGAASISLSALMAALSRGYFSFHAVQGTDGVMLLASIFLLPSTIIAFGVSSMVFAAYEFVQKRAKQKGRQEGLQEGLQAGQKGERERIEREVDALFSDSDSGRVSIEDVRRIVHGNEE